MIRIKRDFETEKRVVKEIFKIVLKWLVKGK